ncbi:TPA: hypothetical protein ACX3EH_003839 [Vibrio parahaemolyticus]|uniref:hypothetical protein n=1 Tax=Vibrio parahaemolyticus TaxID=670 RepID=UPI001B81E6AD|nr:hypothetical protein [Vibrio parahaemolyticus]HCG7968559.1 hypothetical protein [Vibrio parahaemolyticus]
MATFLDQKKRAEIERNGWLVSPSSLDSDAVMILDEMGGFLELHYPSSKSERGALIEDFHWINKSKSKKVSGNP